MEWQAHSILSSDKTSKQRLCALCNETQLLTILMDPTYLHHPHGAHILMEPTYRHIYNPFSQLIGYKHLLYLWLSSNRIPFLLLEVKSCCLSHGFFIVSQFFTSHIFFLLWTPTFTVGCLWLVLGLNFS
jgi:hypothetical protein